MNKKCILSTDSIFDPKTQDFENRVSDFVEAAKKSNLTKEAKERMSDTIKMLAKMSGLKEEVAVAFQDKFRQAVNIK